MENIILYMHTRHDMGKSTGGSHSVSAAGAAQIVRSEVGPLRLDQSGFRLTLGGIDSADGAAVAEELLRGIHCILDPDFFRQQDPGASADVSILELGLPRGINLGLYGDDERLGAIIDMTTTVPQCPSKLGLVLRVGVVADAIIRATTGLSSFDLVVNFTAETHQDKFLVGARADFLAVAVSAVTAPHQTGGAVRTGVSLPVRQDVPPQWHHHPFAVNVGDLSLSYQRAGLQDYLSAIVDDALAQMPLVRGTAITLPSPAWWQEASPESFEQVCRGQKIGVLSPDEVSQRFLVSKKN